MGKNKAKEKLEQPEEGKQTAQNQVEDEETPLIFGRNINIKEKIVKVIELSPDEGRVAISGEIIGTETRELRTGKVLISFDVYDGSSTITCKLFAKDSDEAGKVLSRMKKAKGVKLAGNAQLDQYAGELTIIANNVILNLKCNKNALKKTYE